MPDASGDNSITSAIASEVSAAGIELARRWMQTIVALADHPLRVAFARRELTRSTVPVFATAINEVHRRSEVGDEVGREVVAAFVPTIVDPQVVDKVWAARALAGTAALLSAARLLRGSTPEGHGLDQRTGAPTQNVVQNAAGKPLSLGERRALARRPSRATLDKLMRDPHPMVARIVLGNPRITENDVVRMAAYRPALAGVAAEVAMAWSRSSRVRMALVSNPGVPPAVAIPLLALLSRPELHRVVRATDLSVVIRATAQTYHELRPPMPATRDRREH